MILIGDIGNTETKICLVNSKSKIIRKFTLNTKSINQTLLKKFMKKINFDKKKIKNCLFCSVVPKTFKIIKKFFFKFYKIKTYELKELKLNSLIKIKPNIKHNWI